MPRVRGADSTVQVAVPIDSDVQCIARVRGLPAFHTSTMTNGGASRPIYICANCVASQTPGGCTRSMSASSPLPSQGACAPRLRCALEANVRLRSSTPGQTLVKDGAWCGAMRVSHAACGCALVTINDGSVSRIVHVGLLVSWPQPFATSCDRLKGHRNVVKSGRETW